MRKSKTCTSILFLLLLFLLKNGEVDSALLDYCADCRSQAYNIICCNVVSLCCVTVSSTGVSHGSNNADISKWSTPTPTSTPTSTSTSATTLNLKTDVPTTTTHLTSITKESSIINLTSGNETQVQNFTSTPYITTTTKSQTLGVDKSTDGEVTTGVNGKESESPQPRTTSQWMSTSDDESTAETTTNLNTVRITTVTSRTEIPLTPTSPWRTTEEQLSTTPTSADTTESKISTTFSGVFQNVFNDNITSETNTRNNETFSTQTVAVEKISDSTFTSNGFETTQSLLEGNYTKSRTEILTNDSSRTSNNSEESTTPMSFLDTTTPRDEIQFTISLSSLSKDEASSTQESPQNITQSTRSENTPTTSSWYSSLWNLVSNSKTATTPPHTLNHTTTTTTPPHTLNHTTTTTPSHTLNHTTNDSLTISDKISTEKESELENATKKPSINSTNVSRLTSELHSTKPIYTSTQDTTKAIHTSTQHTTKAIHTSTQHSSKANHTASTASTQNSTKAKTTSSNKHSNSSTTDAIFTASLTKHSTGSTTETTFGDNSNTITEKYPGFSHANETVIPEGDDTEDKLDNSTANDYFGVTTTKSSFDGTSSNFTNNPRLNSTSENGHFNFSHESFNNSANITRSPITLENDDSDENISTTSKFETEESDDNDKFMITSSTFSTRSHRSTTMRTTPFNDFDNFTTTKFHNKLEDEENETKEENEEYEDDDSVSSTTTHNFIQNVTVNDSELMIVSQFTKNTTFSTPRIKSTTEKITPADDYENDEDDRTFRD